MAKQEEYDIRKIGPLKYKQLQEANRGNYSSEVAWNIKKIRDEHPIVSAYDPDWMTEKQVQSSLYRNSGGKDYWGKSMFDDPNADINEFSRLGDIRAENQPWYAQLGAGLGKMTVLAGTTFVEGTLGLLYGAGTAIAQGRWSGIWDNEVTRAMQAINEASEEWMPNYYTEAEQTGPLYKQLGTMNFWADKFIKNIGFSIGAAYGVAALKIPKLVSLLGAGAKTTKATTLLTSGFVSAVSEGSIEAVNNTNDWERLKVQELDDDYRANIDRRFAPQETALAQEYQKAYEEYHATKGQLVKRGTGDMASYVDPAAEKYEQKVAAIDAKRAKLEMAKQLAFENRHSDEIYTSARDKISEDKEHMGNMDLLANIPILTISNIAELGKFYARGLNTARRSGVKVVEEGAEGVGEAATKTATRTSAAAATELEHTAEKEAGKAAVRGASRAGGKAMPKFEGKKMSKGRLTYNITKGALAEGTEEISQKAASVITGDYYSTDVNNFYKSKLDPDAEKETLSWMKSIMRGMNKTVNDSSSWEEFFIGALTGAVGVPMFRSTRAADGSKRSPITLEGGAINHYLDAKHDVERSQEIAAYLNNRVQDPNFLNYYRSFIRRAKTQKEMDSALARDDVFDFKNAEYAQFVSDIIMFDSAGKLGMLEDFIGEALDLSDENLENIVRITTRSETDASGKVSQVSPFQGMLDTKEGKEEMKQILTKTEKKMRDTMNKYRKTATNLDTLTNGILNDEQLSELTYLQMQSEEWSERGLEMAPVVKKAINDIIKNIEVEASSLPQKLADAALSPNGSLNEITSIGESHRKIGMTPQRLETLKELAAMKDEDLARVLSSPNNADFARSLAAQLAMVGSDIISNLDRKNVLKMLMDYPRIGKAQQLYNDKIKEYLERPEKLQEDQEKATEEIVEQTKEGKKQDLRTKLTNAKSVHEFREALNTEDDDEVKRTTLAELEQENNPMAKNYKETTQFDKDIQVQLSNMGLGNQVYNDALALWRNQVGETEDLNQMANESSVHLGDDTFFLEDSANDPTVAQTRFQNARYAVQQAMQKVKEDIKYRDRFSPRYETPEGTPAPTRGVTGTTTGDSGVSTVPPTNPTVAPAEASSVPVGNISSDEVAEENKELNEILADTEETESNSGTKQYWKPQIPELHIKATKDGDFRDFDIVVKEREGKDFSVIYGYLKSNGAFEYLNSGRLKTGDTLGFMIDPLFEEQMSQYDWYEGPTIFFVHGEQVVGDVASLSQAARFEGLTELINRVRAEYQASRQNTQVPANQGYTFTTDYQYDKEMSAYGTYGTLDRVENGVAIYVDSKGNPTIILGARSDHQFVGVFREPATGIWSSKMENKEGDKKAFKPMIAAVMDKVPVGAELMEITSISLDGLRVFAQQLDHGFSIMEGTSYETDVNGADLANTFGLSKEAQDNMSKISVTKEELPKVKEILRPYLEKLGVTDIDKAVTIVDKDTLSIRIPKLIKSKPTLTYNPNNLTIPLYPNPNFFNEERGWDRQSDFTERVYDNKPSYTGEGGQLQGLLTLVKYAIKYNIISAKYLSSIGTNKSGGLYIHKDAYQELINELQSKGFNTPRQLAEHKVSTPDRFYATPKTKVAKMMVGKIEHGSQERSLNDIPGVMDSNTAPIFGIVKNGRLEVNGKVDPRLILTPNDMSNKEGRLYLLIPNGAGTYSPIAVRVKHFNVREFNLNDETVASTEVGKMITAAIEQLANCTNEDDFKEALNALTSVLYKGNLHINWFNGKTGYGIRFTKAEVDSNGEEIYTTNEKGERIRKETSIPVFLSSKTDAQGNISVATIGRSGAVEEAEETRVDPETAKKQITNVLLKFNLPIQVRADRINTPGYNERIIESNVTTSNTVSARSRSTWFVTNPIGPDGKLKDAVPPKSVAPKPTPPSAPSPVGGNESVVNGTTISINGVSYTVDLQKMTYVDEKGVQYAQTKDNLNIFAMAWAEKQYGSATEGYNMTDNKVITPQGRVLDRNTGRFLPDSEAQKVKDKIANRGKVADNNAIADKVVADIYENQKKVDKSRTDDTFYYILEEDGEYHKYPRVHTRIGDNWIGPRSDSTERNSKRSLKAGSAVDQIIRDFFSKKTPVRPDNMSEEAFNALIDSLNQVKETMEKNGETFMADNIVLFYKYPDGTRVAGEVDILSRTKDGNFKIYDVKTSSRSFHDSSFTTKSKYQRMSTKDYYTLQLSGYQNLFQSQYSIKPIGLAIFPFVLTYDTVNEDTVTSIEKEKGITITYNPNVNVPLAESPVAPQQPSTEVSTDTTPLIFKSPDSTIKVEDRENDFHKIEGGRVGYYEAEDDKVYKGYLKEIGNVDGIPIYMTKEAITTDSYGMAEEHVVMNNYLAVFPSGKAVSVLNKVPVTGESAMTDEQAGKRMFDTISQYYKEDPEYVQELAQSETSLSKNQATSSTPALSAQPAPAAETKPKVKPETKPTTPAEPSGAQKAVQAEKNINKRAAKRMKPKLREKDSTSRKVWNKKKELSWLRKVLPQLSEQDRVKLMNGLIQVSENGPYAWGMFDEGIITLSDIAAEGTTYHEAFHVVFNLMLSPQEREALFEEARQRFGNKDIDSLEEDMAEEFREYVMTQEDRSLGRKIRDFFKSLFAKVTHWKYVKPSLNSYYRMINQGKYSRDKLGMTDQRRARQEEYTPEMQAIKDRAIANGTFMKAPNDNPTNLNERQWLQVRTKAFKNWFGDWEKFANITEKELQAASLIFDRVPELAKIGTPTEYAAYIKEIFPNSVEKEVYWHGSNEDFSEGFASAKRGEGSGALETKKRNDLYLNKQGWASLQYVNGINRKGRDKNGFAHWNKLWWELKEIISNGRRENNDWKDIVIDESTIRQAIPNKKGVFNRDSGGKNGKWLSERKADYGYENKSDKEFFEEIFGIKLGKDTFNTWTARNAEIFKSLEKSAKGINPVVIDVRNPIIEEGQNTYYEEQRGLFTIANAKGNDAILSKKADNEFNSDVAVVINANNDNVYWLGTKSDIERFRQWKTNNNASKVVDENGEPLVVYHGTRNTFTIFSNNTKLHKVHATNGFWFTPNARIADKYGTTVMPVFLNIRTPGKSKITIYDLLEARDIEDKVISDNNYDGAILDTYDKGVRGNEQQIQYVAKNPNQIKSATSNNGDFSTTNDDIRYRIVPTEEQAKIDETAKVMRKEAQAFLDNFGITFREVKEFGEDKLFDAIDRVINIRNADDISEGVGQAIAFMMQHNGLMQELFRYKLAVEDTVGAKSIRRSLTKRGDVTKLPSVTKLEPKVRERLINEVGQDIATQLRKLYNVEPISVESKSFLAKLWELITEFFNKLTPEARTKFNIIKNYTANIANSVKLNDPSIIRTSNVKPGTNVQAARVDIAKALRENPYERKIIEFLSSKGIALAGSASIALEGTLYRPDNNPLHDIDFNAASYTKESLDTLIKDNFPNISFIREIQDGPNKITETYLTMDREYTTKDIVVRVEKDGEVEDKKAVGLYDKKGEQLGYYIGSDLILKEGVKGKFLDFFLGDGNNVYPPRVLTINNKPYLIASSKNAFRAKVTWQRPKDIWDYNRFIPAEMFDKIRKQNKEELKRKVQNARIIWGHPAIGKTTYLERNDDIIEWDAEVNAKRDAFFREQLDPEHKLDIESKEYKNLKSEYMETWQSHPEYINFLIKEWTALKKKAEKENKRIFASPAPLMMLFEDDFDLFVALPEKVFLERNKERGGKHLSSMGWKQIINKNLVLVDPNKVVYTDKYFSEFIRDTLGVQWGTLTNEEAVALEAKGWTEEMFKRVSQQERDNAVECVAL